MKEDFVSLDTAMHWDRREVRRNYSSYVNPGIASLLSLIDFDKHFVRAEGIEVWDEDGNRYYDFLGAYGALNLGHNPEQVWDAVIKVRHSANLLQASTSPLAAALAHNLAAVTPGDLKHSFFCNSGAEAVEGAIKTARRATGKAEIIYCKSGFHGKTMGALSVTGKEKYQAPFGPLVPNCVSVPYGDLVSLEKQLTRRQAAAFIVEPVQGEAGIIVPPPGYLKGAEELCRRYDTLLIVDEVQTGLGRTGYLFACEEEHVEPDILCLAKSLGGGVVPLGAFVTTEHIWNKVYGGADKCLLHTSTFGGNGVACAAGIASLQAIITENLAENAKKLGKYMLKRLQELNEQYTLIKDVRGKGLMLGLEFAPMAGGTLNKLSGGLLNKMGEEYIASLVAGELMNDYGIITVFTLNNPNVIRLEPPLIINKKQADYLLDSLEKIFIKHRSALGLALSRSGKAARSLFKRN